MATKSFHRVLLIYTVLSLWLSSFSMTAASEETSQQHDMGGWEPGSEYNRLYVPEDREKFKGTVLDIKEVVPMPGMSPGVAIIVQSKDGDVVTVHLGPRWFIDPEKMGIRKGDEVKVYGVWAEIDNRDVFIASKVKKGDNFEFKVRRTKDGMPYWAMSPEELEKERAVKTDD